MIINVGDKAIEIPDSDYWIKRSKQRKSKYWAAADNLDARMGKEFIKAYNDLEKELYRFAGKFGINGQLTYSQTRIVALMKEIKPYIDNLYEQHQITLAELLTNTYDDNYYKGLYEIASGIGVSYSFVGINETAVKTAISFPWSGENFSDRIYSSKTRLISTLRQEITQSIIRGEAIKKTSTTVSDRLGISFKDAKRLIQTETGAVLSESDNRSYSDFGVEQYEYVATLDDRTTPICRSLDGQVFDIKDMASGLNAPPMHPLCRSSTIPFFDDNFGKRIARDVNSGKAEYVPSNMKYEEWRNKYVK